MRFLLNPIFIRKAAVCLHAFIPVCANRVTAGMVIEMKKCFLIVGSMLLLCLCIIFIGGDGMSESDPASGRQEAELSANEMEVNGQIWEIKNDDSYIYGQKNGERKNIHQINDISTMSFFITKIKNLADDILVVADPQGNGIRNLHMYRYNAEDEEWTQLSIIRDGIVLEDDIFYGHARVNEKGNLELAERVPTGDPENDWEFVVYSTSYDDKEDSVNVKESKRIPGGIPLWWTNS